MNLLNQAYQFFIDEVPELLQDIEEGLLNLRQDSSTQTIHAMMRAAHSIKGGAASVGLQAIKKIAHQLEDYLKALYDDQIVIDTQLEGLFLEGYDCLAQPLKQQMETGSFDSKEALAKAEIVWEKLEKKLENSLQSVKNYIPSSTDLGIDITASIFEVDVAQEIRRLKGVVASPDSFDVATEVKDCLEILSGFGELLNLSGFNLIASIGEQALQKHPNQAVVVAKLLIKNLEKSREQVLNGDRTEGGSPSAALLTLAEDTHPEIEEKILAELRQPESIALDLNDPSYQFFIAEIPDLLHAIETGFLSIKTDKSKGNINEIMRAAHSLKGGSASVGLNGIKDISHKLEDYIKTLFDENVDVDDELETYFLDAFDCLKNALSQQIETGSYDTHYHAEIELIWAKLEKKLGNINVGDYLPSSEDLGIDVVHSIFDQDVGDAIKHLSNIVDTMIESNLREEVILQMEVFVGFSEMFNLQGFKEIAEATSMAIANHPDKIREITHIAIEDTVNARQEVLNGDRYYGGNPSLELRRLAGHLDEEAPEYSAEESWTLNQELSNLDLTHLSGDYGEENSSDLTNFEDLDLIKADEMMSDFGELMIEEDLIEEQNNNDLQAEETEEISFNFDELMAEDLPSENNQLEITDAEQMLSDLGELIMIEEDLIEEQNNNVLQTTENTEIFSNFDELITENLPSENNQLEVTEAEQMLSDLGELMIEEDLIEEQNNNDLQTIENTEISFNFDELMAEDLTSENNQLEVKEAEQMLSDLGELMIEEDLIEEQNNNDLQAEETEEILFNFDELMAEDLTSENNQLEIIDIDTEQMLSSLSELMGEEGEEDLMEQNIENDNKTEIQSYPTEKILPDFADLLEQSDWGLEEETGIPNNEINLINENQTENLIPNLGDLDDFVSNLEQIAKEEEIESSPLADNNNQESQLNFAENFAEFEINYNNNENNQEVITEFYQNESDSISFDSVMDSLGNDFAFTGQNENNQELNIETQSSQQTELQQQSYPFFIEEAIDLLAVIDEGLETVLENRNTTEINEISRAAHSLKGGARSAGLEPLGNIALRVEKSFKALFNENIILNEDLKNYLRELYSLLRQPLMARIDSGLIDEKPLLDQANAMWAQFEAQWGEEITKSEGFLPSSSDLGIDITTSIFEVDVAEGIETIKASLDSGNKTEIKDTIAMQMEVFNGFGEMLSLPGFIEICKIATEALEINPTETATIAQILVKDLELAKQSILNGDRILGGTPSPELLALAGKAITQIQPPSTYPSEQEVYTEAPIDTNDQAYSFFVEEAPELLNVLENGLLTLRQERSTAKIHELMRAAHSIKGGAASVGLEAIKVLAHQLEDIFKALYDETVEIDTELETWLLEGYDSLRNPLMSQIETGTYQPAIALDTAKNVWAKITNKLGKALERVDNFIPSSTDLGVDMVQSMFEIDVAQELDRLKNVVRNPENQPIAGELRATLEVFTGFGQILNLSGFAAIAQHGLIAIDKHPEEALEITKIIIKDAENARTLVLEGDRTLGGEPSPELVAFTQDELPLTKTSIDNTIELESEEYDLSPDINSSNEQIPISSVNEQELTTELNEQRITAIHQEIEEEYKNADILSIEEIFAAEFTQEEINLLAKASQTNLEDDKNITIPSLDDLLNTPNFDDLQESDISNIGQITNSEEQLNVNDLWADQEITFTSVEEDTLQELNLTDTNQPTLEVKEIIEELPSNEIAELIVHITDQTSIAENLEINNQEITQENQPKSPEINGKTTLNQNESNTQIQIETQQDISKQTLLARPLDVDEAEYITMGDLDEAISYVNNTFTKLPGLKKESEIIKTSRQTDTSNIEQEKAKAEDKNSINVSKNKLTLRVDLERLERMNNLIGELSINRNSLSLQNDKLQKSVAELLERFINFQQMANNVRELSDKMLISPEKYGSSGMFSNTNSFPLSVNESGDINIHSGFDSLEMDRYDNLYYVLQELLDKMIQLEESVDDIALYAAQSGRTVEDQRQMLNGMRDELMWARMLPLGEVLNRFPRVLRDLSVKYNKKVNLKLSGTNVLVDKAALEKLYDPLVHLIRNGFDHGIETPQVRKQQGKSEIGQIEVKAYHQGNQTIIEVRDDGGGLNLNKIGQKAIERNILTSEQLAVTSEDNLLDLIFEPGFSTATSVTEISGRGVGLDIVRSQLRLLKGTISVSSQSGVGTTFTLKLPLTLTIDKLLVLSSDSHFYALPSDNIVEISVPESHQVKTSGNKRFLYFESTIIPIYPLQNLINYNCHTSDTSNISQALEVLPTPKEWAKPLLVISLGTELFALEVDSLVSEQELVIKPFGSALTPPSYTYGCTILGDGTLIPVINTSILLDKHFSGTRFKQSFPSNKGGASKGKVTDTNKITGVFQVSSVLVVDDSAAMRRTLALSLEKAGYRVIQAKDGKDALEQLQQQSSNIKLVICDIEMPNMNGFEFLGQRRRYPDLMGIPVAMLTSRSNEKHQKLATHLGASAYFTKPYIEQKFLQAVKNLMEISSPIMA